MRALVERLVARRYAVCVLDPEDERLTIYTEHSPARQLAGADFFELPELLGGFRVPVAEFFA